MKRRGGRADLFPPNRGLQARMAVALAVNAALLAGVLALVGWLLFAVPDAWALVAFAVAFAVIGAATPARRKRGRRARPVRKEDRKRVDGAARRLCLVGDLGMPTISVSSDRVPQSWTTTLPWEPPRLHVTTGLLDRLDDRELEAVVAHELATSQTATPS